MNPTLPRAALVAATVLFSLAPALLPRTACAEGTKSSSVVKPAKRPLVEMVFVLDTTGSMGGLLDGAKTKIWEIVNAVMRTPADRRPEVRIGLVAFRDHGDAYVTKVLPLTADLDKVYATLMEYRAEGGGDGPEDVRQALADGVAKTGWSDKSAVRKSGRAILQTLFLVGDAPPHDDYAQEPDVLTTTAKAVSRGVFVNTIQCGSDGATTTVWQKVARSGEGQYFAIAQDGGVQAIATPYDEQLGKLGAKMGGTYTAFGGGSGARGKSFREGAKSKSLAMEESVESFAATRSIGGSAAAAPAAAADRAVNKALNDRAYNDSDLLTAVENGSVALGKVRADDLPDDLRKLSPVARDAAVKKRLAERKALRAEILVLSKKRDTFMRAEREKKAAVSGKKVTGFDAAVANALKAQAKKRGIGL